MLEKTAGVDWVLIGSKNYLHKEHCVAAFRAKKHVFCEKPLAITLDDCKEIMDAHRLFGFVVYFAPPREITLSNIGRQEPFLPLVLCFVMHLCTLT
jgi:hypothetical protein